MTDFPVDATDIEYVARNSGKRFQGNPYGVTPLDRCSYDDIVSGNYSPRVRFVIVNGEARIRIVDADGKLVVDRVATTNDAVRYASAYSSSGVAVRYREREDQAPPATSINATLGRPVYKASLREIL